MQSLLVDRTTLRGCGWHRATDRLTSSFTALGYLTLCLESSRVTSPSCCGEKWVNCSQNNRLTAHAESKIAFEYVALETDIRRTLLTDSENWLNLFLCHWIAGWNSVWRLPLAHWLHSQRGCFLDCAESRSDKTNWLSHLFGSSEF